MVTKKSTTLIANVVANGLKVVCGVAIGILLTPLLMKNFGVEGFGLFCTVGASGVFFTIFTSTINKSVSRELSFELGGNRGGLPAIFCTIVCMQLVVAAVFSTAFVASVPKIAASIQIPSGWEFDIQICLYLIAIKFGVAILTSPFRALFYAHQQHGILAKTDIVTSVLRFVALGMIYLMANVNPLLVYIWGNFVVTTTASLIIVGLARDRFSETGFRWSSFQWTTLKSIATYASSAFLMTLSFQLRNQGLLLFFNIFFGNVIAASMGISTRASNLIRSGVGVFTQAIQPAITTSTGAAKKETSMRLANLNSASSCLAALVLTLPFFVDAESILQIWLGEFPEYAPLFLRIVCVSIVVTMASYGHASAMHADGRIGWYVMATQIVIGVSSLVAIASVVIFEVGPEWVLLGELAGIVVVAFTLQLLWPKYLLGFPVKRWVREAFVPILMMVLVSICISLFAIRFSTPGIHRAVGVGVFSFLLAAAITFVVALKPSERRECQNLLLRFSHFSRK